jgi:hypothetical protein
MIFIFRQYDSQARIIIYAESYLEAKEALFEFNPWADKIYNILEYKKYEVDKLKYGEILNLDIEMLSYSRILSEKEFEMICNSSDHIINDKAFNDIHNTKVLTKAFAGEDTNLMSTSEFVNALKENADMKDSVKHQIKKMLSIVGDIWFEEIFDKYAKFNGKYIVYGKSRYQCKKLIEKLNEQYKSNRFISYNRLETLIENNYVDDLTPRDIERYDKMVEFMKANNIKKFPFTTYIEEES